MNQVVCAGKARYSDKERLFIQTNLGGTAETCPEHVEGELFVPDVDEGFFVLRPWTIES